MSLNFDKIYYNHNINYYGNVKKKYIWDGKIYKNKWRSLNESSFIEWTFSLNKINFYFSTWKKKKYLIESNKWNCFSLSLFEYYKYSLFQSFIFLTIVEINKTIKLKGYFNIYPYWNNIFINGMLLKLKKNNLSTTLSIKHNLNWLYNNKINTLFVKNTFFVFSDLIIYVLIQKMNFELQQKILFLKKKLNKESSKKYSKIKKILPKVSRFDLRAYFRIPMRKWKRKRLNRWEWWWYWYWGYKTKKMRRQRHYHPYRMIKYKFRNYGLCLNFFYKTFYYSVLKQLLWRKFFPLRHWNRKFPKRVGVRTHLWLRIYMRHYRSRKKRWKRWKWRRWKRWKCFWAIFDIVFFF